MIYTDTCIHTCGRHMQLQLALEQSMKASPHMSAPSIYYKQDKLYIFNSARVTRVISTYRSIFHIYSLGFMDPFLIGF
ncbi:hypothetical protein HanPSC8_Chr01g0026251 [Helianthus annuus]|nr:hypothetical protein HanPSC8_Chr01g0026251 [Helianthus annuus]